MVDIRLKGVEEKYRNTERVNPSKRRNGLETTSEQ